MTENPCKDINIPFDRSGFLRDLAIMFDVHYQHTPGVKDVKIIFRDSQKMSFDPNNCDYRQLLNSVASWSTRAKNREFARQFDKISRNLLYGEISR